METKPGSGGDNDRGAPAVVPDPIGFRTTLWFLGTFVIGAYLTPLLVVGALYAAEKFLP